MLLMLPGFPAHNRPSTASGVLLDRPGVATCRWPVREFVTSVSATVREML